MLNISPNSISGRLKTDGLLSMERVKTRPMRKVAKWTFAIIGGLLVIILALPWTQMVPGKGTVTTLRPDQRPQELHSAIGGRIEAWYVREGDFVEEGDTLMFISEIKKEYFDPALLPRTQSQIDAKQFSVSAYKEKVTALENRIAVLETSKELKLEQARNKIMQSKLKIISDSIEAEVSLTNYQIAQQQYKRQEQLYNEGLKSLTDLESRRLKLQQTKAKNVAAENKLLTSRNELLNYEVSLASTGNEYDEKIAKAKAEKFETLSSQFDAEAAATKLQNAYANYSVRSGFYYIQAPQSGYVTQTLKTGLGEIIKQGEEILTIMPAEYEIAAEIYVDPMNLPLLSKGTEVRLVFDGWPAMVFSGWPGASFGTYGGKVVALDNFASKDGKFRMLVAPDGDAEPWPTALRVGSGVKGMALLNDVPVGYEMWRQLNGFPPEYYQAKQETASAKEVKEKK